MALNISKQVTFKPLFTLLRRFYIRPDDLFNPDYLQPPVNRNEVHPELCIKIVGFDYATLEKYHSFTTKITKHMGIRVVDSFPLPHRQYEVEQYKPNSDIVQTTYTLKFYQRIIHIDDVPAMKLGSWIRVLEAALPTGIQLNIDIYDESIRQKRYLPNMELMKLQSEFDDRFGSTREQ